MRQVSVCTRQERCARGDAWELARKIHQLTKEDKATFNSPSEEWILPAASTMNPEGKEFVVDSRADCEDIGNPFLEVTANGEVQAKEEATVYVRELDGHGDGVRKAGPKQAAADSRGSRTCQVAKLREAGAEWRMSCASRTGKYGKTCACRSQ